MSKIVADIETYIASAIEDALKSAIEKNQLNEAPIPAINIETPADAKNGDFSSNIAMVGAKTFRTSPQNIANAIAENIVIDHPFLEKFEIAVPGFFNFYLNEHFYPAILNDIIEKGKSYGASDFGKGKRVMIEFVSANPTGPMHMGNARGGALGDCLASVMEKTGFDVWREFYVNDAGNQIERFALSLEIRYLQYFQGEDSVELPAECYQGEDIKEHVANYVKEHGDHLLSLSSSERQKALVDYALPKNIQNMKKAMDAYRIDYDKWFLESSLHESGEVDDIIALLTEKGLTYEADGAVWYKNKEIQTKLLLQQGKSEKDIEALELKDEVLLRANGNPTYFAVDVAYHKNKFDRGFEKCIDVWGADHHGHVARMQGALEAIGIGADKLDVLLMQLVRLTRDGEVVRMSKRTGKSITLVDLLEEIPVDALRFMFNMREAGSQMDFDLDLAVETTAQNPVYYCQYAHARIHSILRNLEKEGINTTDCSESDLLLLNSEEEKALIRHMSKLTDELVSAAKHYNPAQMTHYVMELSTLFHKFYNAHRVNCENEALRSARVLLCVATKDTIKNILEMFKITAPERM